MRAISRRGVEVIADTGAYASLGGPVLERACTHAAGPYHYENFECDGWAYYTNNPPAGAFRGFGVTQTCFAVESLLNEMADKIGISPWEIRYRNAIRPARPCPTARSWTAPPAWWKRCWLSRTSMKRPSLPASPVP